MNKGMFPLKGILAIPLLLLFLVINLDASTSYQSHIITRILNLGHSSLQRRQVSQFRRQPSWQSRRDNNRGWRLPSKRRYIFQWRTAKPVRQKKPKVPYTPPKIMEQLRQVRSVEDFIRVFKVKDVTVYNVAKSEKKQVQCGQCNKRQSSKRYSVKVQENNYAVSRYLLDDSTSCRPRTSIYTIPLPSDVLFNYFPSCVERRQCMGCCISTRHYRCSPLKTSVEKRVVFKLYHNGTHESTTIDVVHHKSCTCSCIYSQKDCLSTETFDPVNCQCECRRLPESCGPRKQWSPSHCGCICSNNPGCTVHQVWDDSVCNCVCPKDPCASGLYRDRNTCECKS